MKVLQIANSLAIGGAEKLLLESIPKYLDAGVDMELLLLNGVEHPFLNILREESVCKIHSLGMGSVYNPLHIFRILKFLKQYDIVHVHLFPALYWVAIAKAMSFSKTVLIFTEHNTSNKRREKIIFKWMDRVIYKKYAKIVTVSDKVDELIKSHLKFKNDKFEFIPNGVDIKKIQLTKPLLTNDFIETEDQKIIIQVSSFTRQKDQQTLIKALKHFETPAKLLLVGVGETMEDCKVLVRDLGLDKQVLFLGIRMDVPALLKMADVVVLSSFYEGLSLSSIEALASGNPFVASEAPGLTSVVKDAGILFPIGDELMLGHELDRLFKDDDHYTKVANNCSKRAIQYGIEKVVESHLELYNLLCRSKN